MCIITQVAQFITIIINNAPNNRPCTVHYSVYYGLRGGYVFNKVQEKKNYKLVFVYEVC